MESSLTVTRQASITLTGKAQHVPLIVTHRRFKDRHIDHQALYLAPLEKCSP